MAEQNVVDFFYLGQVVGVFLDPANLLFQPGIYGYEPYRGPGHYHLIAAMGRGGSHVCEFLSGGDLVRFEVRSIDARGLEVVLCEVVSKGAP